MSDRLTEQQVAREAKTYTDPDYYRNLGEQSALEDCFAAARPPHPHRGHDPVSAIKRRARPNPRNPKRKAREWDTR